MYIFTCDVDFSNLEAIKNRESEKKSKVELVLFSLVPIEILKKFRKSNVKMGLYW